MNYYILLFITTLTICILQNLLKFYEFINAEYVVHFIIYHD